MKMRIILAFLTTLVAVVVGGLESKPASVFQVQEAEGLKDGTILTFYFKHKGDDSKGTVYINFYDLPSIPVDGVHDITARLTIERHEKVAVQSNSFMNGNWLDEERVKWQPLDGMPPSDGWWRVDVVKLDSKRLNVFFQGFWSGVRNFTKSLDNVRSVYIISDHVDHDHAKMHLRNNSILVPPTFDQFMNYLYGVTGKHIFLMKFGYFPSGSEIQMSAVLRASGEARDLKPSLSFGGTGEHFFMKIVHKWEDGTQAMYIYDGPDKILCTKEKPNGDLQHIVLYRISQNEVTVKVEYKASGNAKKGYTCRKTLAPEHAIQFDTPFSIHSQHGGHLLYINHTIPRSVEEG